AQRAMTAISVALPPAFRRPPPRQAARTRSSMMSASDGAFSYGRALAAKPAGDAPCRPRRRWRGERWRPYTPATVAPTPFQLRGPRPLVGYLDLPDDPAPAPVVVLCCGFKGFAEWGFFPPLAALL